MQALGARTAIVAPAAKLTARPTTRKVRAIPEREPPKPVSRLIPLSSSRTSDDAY